MSRWKLVTAHYLNCPGTEFEYRETDTKTGRQIRKTTPVPRYVDPRDPADWTSRWGQRSNSAIVGNEEGECIVCYAGAGEPSDIVFEGDPTPDMIPVDEEATIITQSFAERWSYKPDMVGIDYSQSLVDRFQIQMAEVSGRSTKVEGLEELVSALGVMAKTNADILGRMTEMQPVRRV
ncbi:MAG: hypothetical protein ACREHG_00185 [Candidatus Saccharimonadales bacterium]